MLQNKANYLLEILAWQNANQGKSKGKQTKMPELYTPEFMRRDAGKDAEAHDIDDIKALLDRPRV